MPRAVDGTRRADRRKKILKQTKGYRGKKSKLFRTAKDALDKSLQYAYRGRKEKKRDFRSLWIARISAVCRTEGMTYSRFIEGLSKSSVEINRKSLAALAVEDAAALKALIAKAKETLGAHA